MSTQPVPFVSPDDYLRAERAAPFKSEYYAGQIWAMSGVSREHDAIAFNLTALLHAALRGTPCRGFTSDMRVAVADTLYTYPDLTIACGEAHFADAHLDMLTNPTVLIEILSPSTANYDRTTKFGLYRRLPTLREYILVYQDALRVERFERFDDIWATHEYNGEAAVLELSSVGIAIPLAEIYENVPLAPPE
jgi:Uma2 family endonuclease